jgi:hypothetical protein
MEHEDVVAALIAIRPHLPELLGPAQAAAVADRIALLLASEAASEQAGQPVGESANRAALELLSEHPATRTWAAEFLKIPSQLRTFQSLPGTIQHTPAVPRYVCPEAGCPTVWYRFSIAEQVPGCERHRVPLVVAGRG